MAAPTVAVAKAVESLMPSPSMRAGRPERSMTKATKPQKQGGAPPKSYKILGFINVYHHCPHSNCPFSGYQVWTIFGQTQHLSRVSSYHFLPTVCFPTVMGMKGPYAQKRSLGLAQKLPIHTICHHLSNIFSSPALSCSWTHMELVLWVHWEVAQLRVQAGGNGNLFGRSLADQREWHKMALPCQVEPLMKDMAKCVKTLYPWWTSK